MKLFNLFSILTLFQLTFAFKDPIGSADQIQDYTGLYRIKFDLDSISESGVLNITTNLGYGDADENEGLEFVQSYHKKSDNLESNDLKINKSSVKASLVYNGDQEDVSFELKSVSTLKKPIVGTYVQFVGVFQAFESEEIERFSVNAEVS